MSTCFLNIPKDVLSEIFYKGWAKAQQIHGTLKAEKMLGFRPTYTLNSH